jgi:predicted metal-dependent HD superfamily phosphohydrolase
MSDAIKDAWIALAGNYSTDSVLTDAFFEELLKKYTSSRRHYHNLAHIGHLLQLSQQYQAQLQDKDLVDFAIFYHDIIYNVLRKDNEERSAILAVKRLKYLRLPDQKIHSIKLFIEATQTHVIPATMENTADLSFFLDFDMSILAAGWPEYQEYANQVRREYRVYPDKLYNAGRKQFLEKSLQSPAIFHTPLFKDQYEAQARANMEKELLFY